MGNGCGNETDMEMKAARQYDVGRRMGNDARHDNVDELADRLIHNLRKGRIPTAHVKCIEWLLFHRLTCNKLDQAQAYVATLCLNCHPKDDISTRCVDTDEDSSPV